MTALLDIAPHLTDEELAERIRIEEQLRELDRYDWSLHARPEQLAPKGDWNVWLILAGRGWGKTRTGAEWIKEQALQQGGTRWAVVAPTFADVRDTCIEGESGLLSTIPNTQVATYNRTTAEIVLTNGSRIKGFSADEPDRLRGPQHHGAWCDELAAWRYPETYDQLQFGLRLGRTPQTVVTTTPRPTRVIRKLVEQDGVRFVRGNTFDNADNLAPAALEELKNRYEGTRLGRQELYAELLTDTPGALWTYQTIERDRVKSHPDLSRIVVGVDPSGGDDEGNDEQGIIAVGLGTDGQAYVLDDATCKLSPDGWGRQAVSTYLDHDADRICSEDNYGGAMVEHVVLTAARDMGVQVATKKVHASRGKQVRAEPVSALYEQGKVHHVGAFDQLEDQLCNTSFPIKAGTKSPDRLDALVWAITELMLERDKPKMRFRG